jgi:outer membrane receptor protein involved in Fe transport
MKVFFLCIFSFLSIGGVFAQEDSLKSTLWQTSAEEMINQEVKANQLAISLATKTALSPEEAPSVVSVITRDEIEHYGYRDMADLLRSIPGFEFGMDITGLVGLGFRGIWVYEGKCAIMVNGMSVNDLGFGIYSFIGTLPLTMVERVEVVRGSGSVLLGAFAEVAAINIITKSGEKLKGVELSSGLGQVGRGGLARFVNIDAGVRTREFEISLHTGYNATPLSTTAYNDFFGNSLSQNRENTDRVFRYFMTKIKHKNLRLQYNLTSFDYFGNDGTNQVIPNQGKNDLEALNHFIQNLSVEYSPRLSNRLNINVLGEVSQGNAFTTTRFGSSPIFGTTSFLGGVNLKRFRGDFNLNINVHKDGDLTLGIGLIEDLINNTTSDGLPGLYSKSGLDSVFRRSTSSLALFGQYLGKFGRFGLSSGLRYESTTFGDVLAGRLGLTYIYQKFNAKLLFGRSFRVPLGWQAYSLNLSNYNPNLKIEKAYTFEVEVGYKLSKNLNARLNLFFIDLNDPIVYTGATNFYTNFGQVQSRGVEAEINYKSKNYGAYLNYSHSKPGKETSLEFRAVDKLGLIGLPPSKINLGGYINLKKLTFSPTFTWLSEKIGQSGSFVRGETNGVFANEFYSSTLLINFNVAYQLNKIGFNFSVHNLTDAQYLLVQPYYGGHAPLPVNNRQIMLGLKFKI